MTSELARCISVAVRRAGDIVRSRCGGTSIAYRKATGEIVTTVDLEIQNGLQVELAPIVPTAVFLAEEQVGQERPPDTAEEIWIVDPIDGSLNVARGIPHAAVSVALVTAGRLRIGVIFDPFGNEMFVAEAGKGAYVNDRKVTVSGGSVLLGAIVGVGLPHDQRNAPIMLDAIHAIGAQTGDVRRFGSAALDLAYVASGRYDAFVELELNTWDIAAGVLLVNEAGGIVTNWLGEPIELQRRSSVIASTPSLYEPIASLLPHAS